MAMTIKTIEELEKELKNLSAEDFKKEYGLFLEKNIEEMKDGSVYEIYFVKQAESRAKLFLYNKFNVVIVEKKKRLFGFIKNLGKVKYPHIFASRMKNYLLNEENKPNWSFLNLNKNQLSEFNKELIIIKDDFEKKRKHFIKDWNDDDERFESLEVFKQVYKSRKERDPESIKSNELEALEKQLDGAFVFFKSEFKKYFPEGVEGSKEKQNNIPNENVVSEGVEGSKKKQNNKFLPKKLVGEKINLKKAKANKIILKNAGLPSRQRS